MQLSSTHATPAQSTFWKRRFEAFKLRRTQRSKQFNPSSIREIQQQLSKWQKSIVEPWISRTTERREQFKNTSDIEINRVYSPLDIAHSNFIQDLSFPGEYPFTRGIYPTMYRGRPWTMRMFSGYGTPEATNGRLKYLLAHGETGLSIAFDMPTLYGYDADDPRSLGEVGKCGVSVSSLRDMEILFDGIPLGEVSTSMTINAPAAILTCMYAAVGEKQGVPQEKLRGTTQTDILKEYIAQKEWNYPPEAHLRIIRDMMVYCSKHMPNWNFISISGYHIREAGANAVQELAFTLADGFTYVDLGIEAGLDPNIFAPRLSFFFDSCMNFFEEIAKFRAARRIWTRTLKEKYNVKNPRNLQLRFHTQTSGVSLTWQQPLNNIVRTTLEALAAVLGGTQSLHTNSYDEAWALPTDEAAMVALRTQQIIGEETGVTDAIDPLGGSYYLEWLTDEIEEQCYRYFAKIESIGGVLPAIKTGFFQREIAETAYKHKLQLERNEIIEVGVNKYIVEEKSKIRTLKIDETSRRLQLRRLKKLRMARNEKRVKESLDELSRAYNNADANCMYPLMKAVKAYATLGEITEAGRRIFGTWREPSFA